MTTDNSKLLFLLFHGKIHNDSITFLNLAFPPVFRILHKNGFEPIRQKSRFFPSKKPDSEKSPISELGEFKDEHTSSHVDTNFLPRIKKREGNMFSKNCVLYLVCSLLRTGCSHRVLHKTWFLQLP